MPPWSSHSIQQSTTLVARSPVCHHAIVCLAMNQLLPCMTWLCHSITLQQPVTTQQPSTTAAAIKGLADTPDMAIRLRVASHSPYMVAPSRTIDQFVSMHDGMCPSTCSSLRRATNSSHFFVAHHRSACVLTLL